MTKLRVLDASVVVKWFFTDEPLREQAMAVRASVAERPDDFVIPPLFRSETLHVLARKSGRDEKFVLAALGLIERLGLRTIDLSSDAWSHVARWSCRGLSGYDATYVGLAADLRARWLTADEEAASRVGARLAQSLATW